MLTWFAFSLALSAAIIFVVHRLYRFFIQALTCPIEKDIAGSTFDEYKNMYSDIHRGMMAGSSLPANTNGIDTDGVGAAVAAAAVAVAPTNVAPDASRSGSGSVFDAANAGFGGTPFDAEMEPYVRNMSHTYNNNIHNNNNNNNNNNHVPEQSCDALDHRPSRGMMSELNDFIQTNRRLEPALDAREPESFRF